MPIKVKCTNCGKVLAAPDSAVGKRVKCKCGATIQVPAGKSGAAQATAGINPSAFDLLDEEDFNQQAPIDKLYASKQGGEESSRLKHYLAEEKERMLKEATKTKAMVKVMSGLSILFALAYFALAGVALAAKDKLDDIDQFEPMVNIDTNLLVGFSILWGIFMLAGSIGGFLVHKWGWFLLATTYTYLVVNRTAALVFTLMEGFDQVKFYGALIPALIALGLVVFFFREQTRNVFGFSTVIPAILAGLLGLAVGGGVLGLTYNAKRGNQESSAMSRRLIVHPPQFVSQHADFDVRTGRG